MTNRRADTRVPILEPIAARWSPRAFDPDAAVTAEQVTAVLEAARWAATWGGRQPVRFVVGLRGDKTFDGFARVAADVTYFKQDVAMYTRSYSTQIYIPARTAQVLAPA